MSKWDKLLTRICALSKDLRFDELRKVLESYGYERMLQRVEAVIAHSANWGVGRLQYLSTNQSKKYMQKW